MVIPEDASYDQLLDQADHWHQAGWIDAEIGLRRQLLQFQPEDHGCELALAMALLLSGRYQEAWPHYEARLKGPVGITVPASLPRWDGVTALDALVLVAEQGIGDVVMALRWIPLLTQRIGSLTIVAPSSVHSLLRHTGWFADIVSLEAPFHCPESTAWLPLLSIPQVLNLGGDALASQPAYLHALPQQVKSWRQRLTASNPGKPIIALHWQGNPLAERSRASGRSFPLELYRPLAERGNFQLVSLQKGAGEEQLQTCPFADAFVACQQAISQTWDLVETLAIIAACDLVITSDSAVAHLAGALGRPTWILLKAVPDWRWGLSGEATALYPSARLFRQSKPGDWNSVITQLCQALEAGLGPWCNPAADGLPSDRQDGSLQSQGLDLLAPLLNYRNGIFEAHCQFILANYLDPWYGFFKTVSPRQTRLEAVIVETRPTAILRAVILNTLLMTPAGTLVILITSEQSFAAMTQLLGDLADDLEIRAMALDPSLDRHAYNHLLCQADFWQSFSAETILVFQTDSLLLCPLPESFLAAPYLGAPWASDGEHHEDFPAQAIDPQAGMPSTGQSVVRTSMVFSPGIQKRVPHCYGNGGLSLRNRALMETIASQEVAEVGEPEDVFFSRHWPSYCQQTPDPHLASQFSAEVIYADAVGLHASWKYLRADQQALLYEKHIKTLISMAAGLL